MSLAGEASLWDLRVDGVVLSGDSRNGLLQHGQGVVAACGIIGRVLVESAGVSAVTAQWGVSGSVAAQRGLCSQVTGAPAPEPASATSLAPALTPVSVVGASESVGGNAGNDGG